MAEVLITLGIIGVVAALTMPSLIQNYQKKQTAVRLKRFYSIMTQTILCWQHACARLIQMDGWEIRDDYPWKQTILEN